MRIPSVFTSSHSITVLLIFAFLISAAAVYAHSYSARDYLVIVAVPCNPTTSSCFLGDGELTPTFYKQVTKPAYKIADCSLTGACGYLSCEPGEVECEELYCDPNDSELECSE